MLQKRINSWFTHFQKYFFKYKDGFFELTCLLNTPEALVESLKKMPFNKYDDKNQIITCNNFFLDAEVHFQELDEGLWLIYVDNYYKTNLSFKIIYDEYLPAEYYSLSYHLLENKLFKNKSPENSDIQYENETWSLTKPKATYIDSHLKESRMKILTVFFTEKWLTRNVFNDLRFENNNFKKFFDNEEQKYIVWSGSPEFKNIEYQSIIDNVCEKGNKGVANVLDLKFRVYKYIQEFFLTENENLNLDAKLSVSDVSKQLKVENFLIENLKDKFVGVEFLSKKFGISPTKLKNDFKEAYGMSLLQYFQRKQMELAKELIEFKNFKISDLALKFGYENPSKFSRAFLKHNGKLPSFYKRKD